MWKVQESAWGKKERKEFSVMLDFVKHNDSVKHEIFDVIERMTRNDADKIWVIRGSRTKSRPVSWNPYQKISILYLRGIYDGFNN